MRVYIASVFADKDRVKARAQELESNGITCTSRWALEKVQPNVTMSDCAEDYLRQTAVLDVEDIVSSDVVVLTVPTDAEMVNLTTGQLARGGRHFESGMMYGLMLVSQYGDSPRELIILGKRENIFHCLDGKDTAAKFPVVTQKDTWADVLGYLKGRNQ